MRPLGEQADDGTGTPEEVRAGVVEAYADFARWSNDSPCYVEWSEGVAHDPEVQDWIARLPAPKRQPNLVFTAARWHGCPAPSAYADLRETLLGDDGRIEATIEQRATQTNEAGRMATLVPVLAQLAGSAKQPLALLEIGASAGLCLYPDRWGYAWTGEDGATTYAGPSRPVLQCDVSGPVPLPDEVPAVAWRGGIDLHPLDVTDADQMLWLSYLVWPEHGDRRAVLAQAIAVAREEPPRLREGDLLDALPELVAEAGEHGPVVVFHSAVAAYLDRAARQRLVGTMTDLVARGECRWVSNEGRRVLPEVTATVPDGVLDDDHDSFVLGLDGQAVALTHGHGRSMTWLGHPVESGDQPSSR